MSDPYTAILLPAGMNEAAKYTGQFKDREVSSITSAGIDRLLGVNVANATKNHIMDTFRIVLDEAKKAGLVKRMLQDSQSSD
jgi:hypothetical protein